jgi:hypothetical protein
MKEGVFSRTINCSVKVKLSLSDKIVKAGEASNLEVIYGTHFFWESPRFISECQSLDMTMDGTQRCAALRKDHYADKMERMFNFLAIEQAKLAYFKGSKKYSNTGKNIDNYQDWLEVQNSDLPGAWISIWGDRYLDEYKGNGILNLKFKFWTRLKMLFWLPQSRD